MERLQKKQAALRQAIAKMIAAASDPLQSPTIKSIDATSLIRGCCPSRDNNRFRIRIEALEVPTICGDLLQPPDDFTARIAHEQGLQLADTVPDGYHPGVGVELLIGAGHYWDITTGNVKRLCKNIVAMETAFGLTLQGTEPTEQPA
ncbi:hypothetical protein HPB49_009660 [Dermacentor silvarum]|uniref:Uncharacterized protein n=1 Tax=Dermacentor silvarum TaxID=543639 RepID=A0ACB8DYT9_DERSI|nr:hypothetical protein HPB49_009660 [Dermacentor silvarum]